ncbi:MAG TPA: substrate-binding domain-containing protein [Pyrinomonadaceae bacterium]|nr:substrate-binding domain-containing protein [Pyrinomonadaceae bacterium]
MSSRSLKIITHVSTRTTGRQHRHRYIAFVALSATVAVLVSCAGQANAPQQQAAQAQERAQLPAVTTRALRVCADPNNLPFSNERGEGFENKLAELVAREMHTRVEYTWWAQRRGFFRNTLKAGLCDVVLGVPSSFELTLTTSPYYRSTYVFVSRKDRHLGIRSFDDAALRQLKVGVQLIGDDSANTPPAHALSARKIIQNVVGYTVYGDYAEANPPARIIDAVARGDVDVAVAWGPLAGYFARRSKVALEVVPVSPQFDLPFLPFVYDISMGVRRGDDALKEELERILELKRAEIEHILDDYGVPRAGVATQPQATS